MSAFENYIKEYQRRVVNIIPSEALIMIPRNPAIAVEVPSVIPLMNLHKDVENSHTSKMDLEYETLINAKRLVASLVR